MAQSKQIKQEPASADLQAKADKPSEDALRLHPFYRGKVQLMPKCPIRGPEDFAIWYTPGVAAPCKAIQQRPELVYEYTNKANTIAIVSDGSRVLGLGDIGPEAGLPVMEGKALLFKVLGGVDAMPICLRTSGPEEIVRTVRHLEPSFGGINLEDIAQPQCFRVLDSLRRDLSIPVWHDDQQGSACVLLAGLTNALKLVGKDLHWVRVVMFGMGAANVAGYRLLTSAGLDPQNVVACDSKGVLHKGRSDIEAKQDDYVDKWRICRESNAAGIAGDPAEAFRGADVCVAFSRPGPGIIAPDWVRLMAADPIVFACANPVPEIWPWEARAAGARIVATGRSDFPNQVNNSLGFPGIFRGVLDVRARRISDDMVLAAASELAAQAEAGGLHDERILTGMDDWRIAAKVAVAVGATAQAQGLARRRLDAEAHHSLALETIRTARAAAQCLYERGIIPPPPAEGW
jgi:malate dehydrogenase (oxaloacetate-decarboxylating)